MKIRKGRREDLQYIPPLLMNAYRGMEKYGEESIEKARKYVDDLYNEDPECFFVAEEKGKIIGFIFCNRFWYSKFEKGVVGAIHEIATSPDKTGQGIGRKLMEEAVKFMDSEKIELWVGVDNSKAIQFYKNLGFKEKERVNEWLRMIFIKK